MGVIELGIFSLSLSHFLIKDLLIGPDRRYTVHDALEDFRRVLGIGANGFNFHRQMPGGNARRWLCDHCQRACFDHKIALIGRGLDVSYQVQAHRQPFTNDVSQAVTRLLAGGFRYVSTKRGGLVQP